MPLPKGTVDALIRGAADDKAERMERGEAAEYLEVMLATGPVPVKDIMKEAKASGIAPRTLARAKAELGVKSDKAADKWYWRLLPEKPTR